MGFTLLTGVRSNGTQTVLPTGPLLLLTAKHAISEQMLSVAANAKPSDYGELVQPAMICAVFRGAKSSMDPSAFLGLVPANFALRYKHESFLDLASKCHQYMVEPDATLDTVIWAVPSGSDEPIAVLKRNDLLGVITRDSLLSALFRSNKDYQEKLKLQRRSAESEKRTRAEWEKREQELNKAFRKLVSLLAKPAGPDLFQRGIEALCVLLDASYGAVVLKDEKGQLRERIFAGVTPGDSKNMQTFLKQRKPLIDHVLEKEGPVVIADIPGFLNSISFPLGHPIMHTFIGVPILREQDCFGCIYLCGEKDDQQFSEEDQIVASSFSQALALVLSQAKDRAERKRLQQERELISQLGLQLSGADTIEKAAGIICNVSDQCWHWQTCSISIRRSGYSRFRYVKRTTRNSSEIHDLPLIEYDLTSLPEHRQVITGEAVLIEAQETGQGTRLMAPVRVESEVLALIEVAAPPDTELGDADLNFIQRLSDTLGPTIARCQAESRNAAFLSLAFKLTAATTAEEAARVIVHAADELIGFDSCSVVLHHPELGMGQGILHMDVIDGVRQDVVGAYRLLQPPGSIAQRAMTEGPQLILRQPDNVSTAGLGAFGDVARPSLSLMFVPFRMGTRVTGVFSIQSYTPNAYNQKDVELLQALADYCAGAVERIRLAQGIPDPIDYPDTEPGSGEELQKKNTASNPKRAKLKSTVVESSRKK